MSARWRLLLPALLLALAAGMATAADNDAAGEAPGPQEELYQAALRALAEGRPNDATDMLSRLIEQQPRHAGAWLELAITQCDLGNADEAERLFRQIEQRFNPPPGILEVIATHRARGCQRLDSVRPASWQLAVGRGHDSNVNQGTYNSSFTIGGTPGELTPEFLPHADSYQALSASYVRPLNAVGSMAIVQLYDRRNDHEHSQDSASVLAGVEHAWTLGRWRARATGAYSAITLDGKLYQRQEQVQLRASPPVTLPDKLDFAAMLNVSHVSYPSRPAYDGNTLELGGVLSYRGKADQGQFILSKLHDNGSSARPGGNRDGWYASAQWYTVLGRDLYGEAALSQQFWRGSSVYSPDLVDIVRRQHTTSARAALQWYFRQNLSLHLEGRLVRNRENISLFEYNSRALQLSLRWDNF
ncbi:tetratricopeptide repeat protein [Duganella sp.]|uniref:tetratricopeptide repeat protein n=1 Tax=Duganella sp. TaxID=1904440 RepID=UPI0031E3F3C9